MVVEEREDERTSTVMRLMFDLNSAHHTKIAFDMHHAGWLDNKINFDLFYKYCKDVRSKFLKKNTPN